MQGMDRDERGRVWKPYETTGRGRNIGQGVRETGKRKRPSNRGRREGTLKQKGE